MENLFIPEKIRVGFQKREDTYTKKLAYVIYYDQKGVLRKEKSWDSWRSKSIEPITFDNEPTEGFVLNKNVGGYKSDWNYRNAHIRVYDPRDFEFEISLENLLYILRETDCSRGKGLEGKFTYAWSGTELILMPVSSAEYVKCKEYTRLQSHGVSAKYLVPGRTYVTRKNEEVVYLGRFTVHNGENAYDYGKPGGEKRFVFSRNSGYLLEEKPIKIKRLIAEAKSDAIHPDFHGLLSKFNDSRYGSRCVELFSVASKNSSDGRMHWVSPIGDGSYNRYVEDKGYKGNRNQKITGRASIVDGVIVWDWQQKQVLFLEDIERKRAEHEKLKNEDTRWAGYHRAEQIREAKSKNFEDWLGPFESPIEPMNNALCVRLESGSCFYASNWKPLEKTDEQD